MSDELKTLLPEQAYTLENGNQVIVSPVPFGKLRIFSGAIASLMEKIGASGVKLENVQDYTTLFDIAFEETAGIMMLVMEKDRDWFDGITIADGMGLLALIIEQNMSEAAKKNLAQLIKVGRSLLLTRSNTSSSTATALKKSKNSRSNKS